jgi:chaperone modulatory protein CbpM
MTKEELVIIADYSDESSVTLQELCEISHLSLQQINDLVEYGIIHPYDETSDEWMFNIAQLVRIKRALRLQQDLEINLAGLAVVLDLLDELEALRARIGLIEKHY